MNSKKIIGSIAMAGILAGCGTPKNKNNTGEITYKDSAIEQTQKELTDTLSHNKKNTITIQPDVILFDIQEMMKEKDPSISVADGKSLLWMLGSLDVDTIIKQYNPHLLAGEKPGHNRSRQDVRGIDTLYVPLIFPSMKDFFNPELENFLFNNPALRDSVMDDKTVIIVTELPNGHFGLGYYQDGILQLAYPISIGDGKRHKDKFNRTRYQGRSPQGRFWVKRKHANKRSKARDSMAYYLELVSERGLGLHGQKTQSKRQSHGCFRQPQLAAKMLFERVVADSTDGTPFVSQRTPNKTEMDSTKYYTQIHPALKDERLKRQDTLKTSNQKDTIEALLQKKKDNTILE